MDKENEVPSGDGNIQIEDGINGDLAKLKKDTAEDWSLKVQQAVF